MKKISSRKRTYSDLEQSESLQSRRDCNLQRPHLTGDYRPLSYSNRGRSRSRHSERDCNSRRPHSRDDRRLSFSDRERSRSRRSERDCNLRRPYPRDNRRLRHQSLGAETNHRRAQVSSENHGDRTVQPPTATWPMGFRRLHALLQQETPENIATVLAANTVSLEKRLLEKNNSSMACLLIELFAKIVQNGGHSHCLAQVLQLILQCDFTGKMNEFVHNLPNEQRVETRQQASTNLMNWLKVMNALLIILPVASESKVALAMTVIESVLGRAEWWPDDVREYFAEVMKNLEHMREERAQKNERSANYSGTQPAPDNFREIPVFPKLTDIDGTVQPFLRPNLMHEAYESIHHYLDVQYRLFREDFIRPLRAGFNELKCGISGRNGKVQNVRVYEDVKVECVIPSSRGITHRLHFSNKKLRGVKWESSKRLMSGNLLCLSSDGFKEDVLFAVVNQRKPADLGKGYFTAQFVIDNNEREGALDAFNMVELEDDDSENEIEEGEIPVIGHDARQRVSFQKVYTMVESQVFFEAYRHVLAAFKKLEAIPLERYIVYCRRDLRPAKYLADTEERVCYDFSMLTGDTDPFFSHLAKRARSEREIARTSSLFEVVDVLDRAAWPPLEDFQLNESQVEALRLALTNELAIIQGPPGTGKTHVGLAIMKVLLKNKERWYKTEPYVDGFGTKCPILVVCYTNHALDQFLEGIAKFSGFRKIIRLGGRCKNQKTEKFSLFKRRREGGAVSSDAISQSRAAALRNLRVIKESLQKNLDDLQSSQHSILKMKLLQQFIPRFLLYDLCVMLQNEIQASGGWDHVNWRAAEPFSTDSLLWWLGVEGIAEKDDFVYVSLIHAKLQSELKEQTDESNHNDDDAKEETSNSFPKAPGSPSSEENCQIHWDPEIELKLQKSSTISEADESAIEDIYSLSLDERWRLYRTWIGRWRDQVRSSPAADIENYNRFTRVQEEIDTQIDFSILNRADVIAATTTGAAKNRSLLYNLNCKIVVVEEAAEVLEAHVITAMPKSTEHLILIGDHKQLRPSPNVHDLAKNYNLDVSLFERLVKKVPHVTLTTQHRMRPEIADLVRPHIYRQLQDHHSVRNRRGITGIEKTVFFLSHTVPEERVTDGHSKKNQFEADFLIALCEYIILQGYRPDQITILAMYNGQMQAFQTSMKNKEMSTKVRVTAVDNFQGEENDIILLSLVRSNYQEKIGFLSVENRICVALSRAKHALYCVGNMKLLASKSSLWRKIVRHLRDKESIGDVMMLQCKNHPDALTPVRNARDFSKAPAGGCGKECGLRLDCGHVCPRPCHPDDHENSKHRCTKPCDKMVMCLCGQEHKCSANCGAKCVPITEHVMKVIPACEHEHLMLCTTSPSTFKCSELMEVTLPCEHETLIPCHQTEKLKASLCKEKCQKLLTCEHYCKGNCQDCFQGRLHVSCENRCGRILVCGHICKSMCSLCPPCEEKCKTRCKHSTCSKKCGEPCVQCKEDCHWECPHFKCTKLCGEPCNRPPCNKPCRKRIKCGHSCIGLCGEPCPNLCKICDEATVKEIFFGAEDEDGARFVQLEDCGHVFTYESLDRWMEQSEDGNAVKMKECPKCKVTIWRSTRYGSIINGLIDSLNKVKRKVWGSDLTVSQVRSNLIAEIKKEISKSMKNRLSLSNRLYLSGRLPLSDHQKEMIDIQRKLKKRSPLHEIVLLQERFRRLQALKKVTAMADERLYNIGFSAYNNSSAIRDDLHSIRKWVLRSRTHTTEEDSKCFRREIGRIKHALKFVAIENKYEGSTWKKKNSDSVEELRPTIDHLRKLLLESISPYDESKEAEVQNLFQNISVTAPNLLPALDISEEEKKMICSAMEFAKKGHWYKCPNGHVYCIGECGGATEVSQCPECKVEIGGTSHMLLESNSVANEMDGGTRPAYDVKDNRIPQHLLEDLRREGFE